MFILSRHVMNIYTIHSRYHVVFLQLFFIHGKQAILELASWSLWVVCLYIKCHECCCMPQKCLLSLTCVLDSVLEKFWTMNYQTCWCHVCLFSAQRGVKWSNISTLLKITMSTCLNSSLPWTKWPSFWQTTFLNEFSWMKMVEFRSKFQGNLFSGVNWQ